MTARSVPCPCSGLPRRRTCDLCAGKAKLLFDSPVPLRGSFRQILLAMVHGYRVWNIAGGRNAYLDPEGGQAFIVRRTTLQEMQDHGLIESSQVHGADIDWKLVEGTWLR